MATNKKKKTTPPPTTEELVKRSTKKSKVSLRLSDLRTSHVVARALLGTKPRKRKRGK